MYLRRCKVDLISVKILTKYNAQRHLLEEKLKDVVQHNDAFGHYDRVHLKQQASVSTVVSCQGTHRIPYYGPTFSARFSTVKQYLLDLQC